MERNGRNGATAPAGWRVYYSERIPGAVLWMDFASRVAAVSFAEQVPHLAGISRI